VCVVDNLAGTNIEVSLRYDLLRPELLRYDVWSTAGERRL